MVYFAAIFIGMMTAIQSTMNRQIATHWGLTATLLMTGISMISSCLLFYFFAKQYPQYFPDFFRSEQAWTGFKLWYVIPGFLGLLIVLGFPFAIAKIGATSVFLLVIVGQITVSVCWDIFVEKMPLSFYRLVAVGFCAVGAYLSTKSS
jgi:uncharacterized membrane protein YdcZ (DUF606 family)